MIKNLAKKLAPWFDRDYYLPSTMWFLGGIVVLVFHFKAPTIESNDDLYTIEGEYIQHSFTHRSGRGGGYYYYLWLNNYSNPFQIKADFIDKQIKERFDRNIQKGEILTLQIPKTEKSLLNSNDQVLVYSIKSSSTEYLSSADTMRIHNSKLMLYLGIGVISLGLMYYAFRKRYLSTKEKKAEYKNS